MANTDWPHGLRPYKAQGGADLTDAANLYYVPSSDGTAIYIGGLVKLAGSSDSDGVPSVTSATATGDKVVGVVVGVVPTTRSSTTYREASTERYLLVCDDPNQLFVVQDDASATLAAANVGNTASLTGFTSGSTVNGHSAIEISATTAAATGTLDVIIRGLDRRPDNSIGQHADWIVRLNHHVSVDGFAGA